MNKEQKKVWEILKTPPKQPTVWGDFDIASYVSMIKAELISTNEARKIFYEQYLTVLDED
jgi:hypothetical protein